MAGCPGVEGNGLAPMQHLSRRRMLATGLPHSHLSISQLCMKSLQSMHRSAWRNLSMSWIVAAACVCTATIRRAFRAQGIVRLKATRQISPMANEDPKRYGYTAAYRREDVTFHSTNMTDPNGSWSLTCSSALQASEACARIPGPLPFRAGLPPLHRCWHLCTTGPENWHRYHGHGLSMPCSHQAGLPA